jgi:multicomponent Na+:H+ antiporter subunit E
MATEGSVALAVVVRAVGFLALWMILAGFYPADLPAIVVAVGAATWVSLRLLPPGAHHWSLFAIARLALRFPYQSVVAGVDVAWRALAPDLRLRPGFVTFSPRLPPSTARDAFCALASLMPGTLPADTNADGTLLVHCLDIGQPAAAQLAVEEALFAQALGRTLDDV